MTRTLEWRSADPPSKIIFYLKRRHRPAPGQAGSRISTTRCSWMVLKAGGIYAYPSGESGMCALPVVSAAIARSSLSLHT